MVPLPNCRSASQAGIPEALNKLQALSLFDFEFGACRDLLNIVIAANRHPCGRLIPDCRSYALAGDDLEAELFVFPCSRHDDQCDSIGRSSTKTIRSCQGRLRKAWRVAFVGEAHRRAWSHRCATLWASDSVPKAW